MSIAEFDLGKKSVGCVFVGNPLSFSDTAMRLIELELTCVTCVRTPAVNDLLLMGPRRREALRLIVVDEALMGQLGHVVEDLWKMFPMASIAMGFRHPANAHAMIALNRSKPNWGRISLLPMNVCVDSWLSLVQLLFSGETYIPSQLFWADTEEDAATPNSEPSMQNHRSTETCQLTKREEQVLACAAEGKQNKIIAAELDLSQHTVKLHMHHIIAKLGVHNRTEAANWFHGRSAKS